MGRTAGLAAAGLIALALAAEGRVAAQPRAADPQVTIRYAGTLDTSWAPIMKQPDGRNLHSARYEWSLTWRGRLSTLQKQPTQQLTVGTLKGTVQYADRTSAEHADCSGAFKPRVKTISFTASLSGTKLAVNVRVPVSTEFLLPTNTTSLHEFCSEVVRWALPGNEMIPTFQVDAAKGGTDGRDVTVGPLAPNRERAALEHSVTVTIAGAPAARGGIDMKAKARRDFQRALERAKGPCLHLAISGGVLATGAVWLSAAAAVPGGIPAGGAVIATGEVMANAVAPLCASVIEELVTDYSIFKRDPPVSRAAHVVSLPECTRWSGALRDYCVRLEEAVTALVGAEHRVVVVLGRVQRAANALAAARKAGNGAGVTAAERTARAETAALATARTAASAAGKKVAAVIRGAGVRGRLTTTQSTATTKALLAALARRGVPAADVRAVAPGALAPKPVDVLATLGA